MDLSVALRKKFGTYKIQGREWVFEICPFCGNVRWNFQVCPSLRVYRCWVCESGGSIGRLLRQYGILDVELEVIEKSEGDKSWINLKSWEPIVMVRKEATSKSWWKYFSSKNIDVFDLTEWGMRVQGDKVLFPVFENGVLVYYVIRNMKEDRWTMPRGWKKNDCVVFHRKSGANEVVVVEGFMDGVKVSKVGYNVIVLLGTNMYSEVVKFLKDSKMNVYLALDPDVGKDKLDKIKYKLGGFKLVDVSSFKDPAETDVEVLKERIGNAVDYGLGLSFRRRWK